MVINPQQGLMISRDTYEGMRQATLADVDGILTLIRPLLDRDVLTRRSGADIETQVDHFSLREREGAIVACASLEIYDHERKKEKNDNVVAEIGCVAVDPEYQKRGHGLAILSYVLRRARALGVTSVFLLTTQTSHWFVERGFELRDIEDLPLRKQQALDPTRQSKVYFMDLRSHRVLDEQELLSRNLVP